MKIYILFLLSFILGFTSLAQSQPVVNRSSDVLVVQDGRFMAKLNLYAPRYADTTAANVQIGIDSCGAQIFTYDVNSFWVRACNPKRWIRLLTSEDVASILANQGLSLNGDTVQLGGRRDTTSELIGYSKIKVRSRLTTGSPNTGLILTNQNAVNAVYPQQNPLADSSTSIYDNSLLYMSRLYNDDDTVHSLYSAPIQIFSSRRLSPSNNRYNNTGADGIMTASQMGMFVTTELFGDTTFIQSAPYGLDFSAYDASWQIGGNTAAGYNHYYLNILSQPNISHPYPLVSYRSGVDLARGSGSGTYKREMYGTGHAGYIWDYRNVQGAGVTAGSAELGSYHNKLYGYMAYGDLGYNPSSPSKAKSLAVAENDSVFAFISLGMNLPLNNVRNGYGFVSMGVLDYNYFAGRTRIGGILPTNQVDSQTALLQINGQDLYTHAVKVDSGKVTIGAGFEQSANVNIQSNDTTTSITGSDIDNSNTAVNRLTFYNTDDLVTLSNSRGLEVFNSIRARDSISLQTHAISGASAELGLFKMSSYNDTTTFVGRSTPDDNTFTPATGFFGRLNLSQSGLNSTKPNLYKGYFSAITASVAMNGAFNQAENIIWLNTGGGQIGGTGTITNGYALYINALKADVTNKYSIMQDGTLDTNYFAGKIRIPNLVTQTDTSLYKPTVVDTNGNLFKFDSWGASSALFTANNGLNKSSITNVQMGGPFTGNTSIGSITDNFGLTISRLGTSAAVTLQAVSNTGTALNATTTSGTAFISRSNTGLGGLIAINPSTTNTFDENARLERSSQGTALNGIGGYLSYTTKTSDGSLQQSGRIGTRWDDVTTISRTSRMEFWTQNNATIGRKMAISGPGQLTLDEYIPSNFTSSDTTSVKPIGVDATGNVYRMTSWFGSGGASDNWGSQVVEHDITLTGTGVTGNELKVDTTIIATNTGVRDSIDANATYFRNPEIGDTILVQENDSTFLFKSFINGFGVNSSTTDTTITISADTTRDTGLPTYFYVDSLLATVGGGLTMGTIDSETKSANGAVINGSSELVLQTAEATFPGLVSTGAQTFAGLKTSTGGITVQSATLRVTGGNGQLQIDDRNGGEEAQIYNNNQTIYFKARQDDFSTRDSIINLSMEAPINAIKLYNTGQLLLSGYSALTQQTDTTGIKPLGYNTTTGLIEPMQNWFGGSSSSTYGIDSTVIGGTSGSVLFVGSDNSLQQDNANFSYDSTNSHLYVDKLQLAASTTAEAKLNVPHGSGPLTLANGDLWTTTAGLFGRINGVTVQFSTSQFPFGTDNTTLWAGVSSNISSTTSSKYTFGGASSVQVKTGIGAGNNNTLTANTNYGQLIIANGGITEAASGTHALITGQTIKRLTVTDGSASVTNTALLYLEGAMTATVSGNNYVLWADEGLSRFDSTLELNNIPTGLTTDLILVKGADSLVKTIAAPLNGSATLDFGSTAAGTSTDLTITVTGAVDGDVVSLGVPNGSTLSNGCFTTWVSAADTVTVRFTNNDGVAALDPASGTFKVKVFK